MSMHNHHVQKKVNGDPEGFSRSSARKHCRRPGRRHARRSNDAPDAEHKRATTASTKSRARVTLAAVGCLTSIGAVLLLRLPATQAGLIITAILLCAAVPVVGWTVMLGRLISRGCEVVQSADELALLVSGLLFFRRPVRPGAAMTGPDDSAGIPRIDRRREHAPPATFWDALTTPEQDALRSVATPRTFPRGATLFREGERADHVVVIQAGWTKICVHENGRERLLAGRGPGQLVGERAALQVNVRSATVVALDTVEALVLRTQDFADFISAHTHVLALVESQVYHRLTENPGTCLRGDPSTTPETGPAGAGPAGTPSDKADPAGAHPPRLEGQNCTIVSTDIAKFGALTRTADDRLFIQRESFTMMREAFRRADIPWDGCHRRDRGDGLLIVVPPAIPTATVMAALAWLATDLKRYNRRAAPAVRIQLRTAVHIGPVTTGETGLRGEALILVARLLEAPVLKRSMAETGAVLGVMASAYVYDSVIRNLDVEGYNQVRFKVKESRLAAWMCLTDSALLPPGSAAADRSRASVDEP